MKPTHVAVFVRRATANLRAACGLREPEFARTLDHLAALVAADPFAGAPDDVYQQVVSFVPRAAGRTLSLPLATPRRDVEVVRVDAGEVFSVVRRIGTQAGPANAFLERLLGQPATTRSWGTVRRLVERFG